MGLHRNLQLDDVHVVHAYEFADASARVGASGLTSADVGKVARQLDTNSFWVLTSHAPVTWQGVSGEGALGAHAVTHAGGGSDAIAVATSSVAGLMSGADKTKLDAIPALLPTGVFWYGAATIGLSVTPRYLVPGYTSGLAPTARAAVRAPRSGVLRNLRVQHNTAGVGGLLTYTVRINGADTLLQVSVLTTAVGGSDTTHTPSVSADDLIELVVTKAGSIVASPEVVVSSIEYA